MKNPTKIPNTANQEHKRESDKKKKTAKRGYSRRAFGSQQKIGGQRMLFGGHRVPGMRPILINGRVTGYSSSLLFFRVILFCAIRACVCGDMITVLWPWYTVFDQTRGGQISVAPGFSRSTQRETSAPAPRLSTAHCAYRLVISQFIYR